MKLRNRIIVCILSVGIFVFILQCARNKKVSPDLSLVDMYRNAVADAMIAEENEISENLVAIEFSNPYLTWKVTDCDTALLVVNWTDHPERFSPGDSVTNWWDDTWVTVVPEIKEWFAHHPIPPENIQLRLEQVLGLPNDSSHTHFVELWVKPAMLFRPAPDNEITDSTVGLVLPANADGEHVAWYHRTIIGSYFPPAYPWTRLGYTYDWGSDASEIGLSEFIIRKDSKFFVKSKSSTKDYFYK